MTPFARVLRWLGGLTALVFALSGVAAAGAAVIFFMTVNDLPKAPEPLRRIIETPRTEIYAANGELMLEIGGRDYVPLDEISLPLIQAILAIEDHLFWEHHGINKLRTFKRLWMNLFSSGRAQGASTITQQLAKNLFFSFRQTYARKFREILVAMQIEAQFSKQEILEAYINQIYFRPNAQGVGVAAAVLFGKKPAQLNLAESALLAGLLKSPTRYNPLRHPERAKARQKVVLHRMAAAGFITAAEADDAQARPLVYKARETADHQGGYFMDWVLKTLEERYGPQVVYHGGLKVTTTLDTQMQLAAEDTLRQGLAGLEKMMGATKDDGSGSDSGRLQGALVAVQVNSGAVKALVGGRDYAESEFNRAVESNRLPGSGFKPFLYYTAFERLGLSPLSVVIDQPVHIPVAGAPDWTPRNFEREYLGPLILKKAFMNSINTVAAQLVAQTGPEAVIATARRCGVTASLEPVYSVALGTSGVSPLQMASAFSTIAAAGVRHEPFGIWRVEDALGQVLEEHIVSGARALDPQLSFQVLDMMQGVVDEGSGKVIRKLGFAKPAAGKTGTTNDFMDAWFTGFTPTLSTCVWVGYDQPVALKDTRRLGITGGRGAAPIWARFMGRATEGEPSRPFSPPPGIRMQACDPISGQTVDSTDPNALWVALRQADVNLFKSPHTIKP